MKRWQVILDLVCDISEYLNTDVSQNEQKSINKEDNRVKEQNEDNLTDFETIKNLMNESEKLKKTSDEELNIMRSFLNSLTDNEE